MSEREPIPQEEAINKRPMNAGEAEDDFEKSLEEAEKLEKANPEIPETN
ncbi:MAG: hypothetical protein NUV80_04505 [Candidatus Berkelbacteria bacterium]|nr:hypothetical protein [Candidatus Berkelbacteria bacterium]MCR4307800.1 hypothetical protein [Candidatus Berkelbacteria bacterium]